MGDEMRQQSEAKAKDEVDATMSHSTRLIKSLQSEFDERVNILERHVMSEQKFLSQEVNQELNTIKSKTDSFHAKLDENSSSLTAKIGIIESNFSQRINEFDKNVITQLQKIEIENQIQESQFIHAEKVQYVESLESKVKQMNEDQKRQEVEAKEELEHMIENNHKEIKQLIASYEEKLISSNQRIAKETESNKNYRDLLTGQLNEMSAALDKFNETIQTENESIRDAINSSLEDSEKKFGLQEELIQNSVVNYQEQLEGRIRELSEETKLNSKSLFEIEPLAKSMDNRILTLQNSNAERLEVLKEQILIENTRHIESIKTEVSTSLVSVKE